MPKPIQYYADIAVELVRLYETRQKALMDEKKAGELRQERFIYEGEVGELEKVFLADYADQPELQGSFHDFITEIQRTPGNYEQSYRELMDRLDLS